MKLIPVEHSNQPVSANYSTVAVAQGIAYVDFGFIEPQALALLARAAQNGQLVHKGLEGKLAVRVATGLDVLQRLHQQLQQVLMGVRAAKGAKQ